MNVGLSSDCFLVLGNEGTGIKPTILAQCSGYITIPSPFGEFELPVGLDSLNVSVATGKCIAHSSYSHARSDTYVHVGITSVKLHSENEIFHW